MKVCYPFFDVSMTSMGGSHESTLVLASALREQIDERIVFSEPGTPSTRADAYNVNFDILQLPIYNKQTLSHLSDNRKLNSLLWTTAFPYILKAAFYIYKKDIDIIHINDMQTCNIWGVAAFLTNTKTVFHVRGEYYSPSSIAERVRFLDINELVYVSESVRDYHTKRADIPGQVVYNGVDISHYSPPPKYKLHDGLDIDKSCKFIGFVGNMVRRKRPVLFIEGAVKVLERYDDVHVVMIGEQRDKGLLGQIEEIIESSGVGSRVHLLGFRNDMPDIMPDLDVLALTSEEHGEAFPRVIIEAMSSGTPVVTSDSAGASEAVVDAETGLVLSSDPTPGELSDAICSLISNENKLYEFAHASRERAKEMFSAEQMSNKILYIYSDL